MGRRATERYFYRYGDKRGEGDGGRERLCRGNYQVRRPNDIFHAQVYGPFPPGTTLTSSGKQWMVDETRKETGFRFRSAVSQVKPVTGEKGGGGNARKVRGASLIRQNGRGGQAHGVW